MANKIALIIAATIAVSVSPAVHAQTAEVPTITVSYSDLDLSTPTGQERLTQRVESAAKRVCGSEPDNRELVAKIAFKTCFDNAQTLAMKQVRSNLAQNDVATKAR